MATTKKAPETKETSKPAKAAATTKAAAAVAVKIIKPYHSIALKRRVERDEVIKDVAKDRADMLVEKGLVEII